jgi:hypothetical protein
MRGMPPLGLRPTVEYESRAGVDGLALWQTGERGREFAIETFTDIPAHGAASMFLRSYESSIGRIEPVEWSTAVEPFFRALVLDVEPLEVHALVNAVGGLFGGLATFRCQWRLLTILSATF